jgi:hypothetical protein
MKKVLSISEVVGERTGPAGRMETCATAEALFDDSKSQLEVALDSFCRPVDLRAKERHERPAWLPQPQVVHSQVDVSETLPASKDIFRSWAKKVSQAASTQVN